MFGDSIAINLQLTWLSSPRAAPQLSAGRTWTPRTERNWTPPSERCLRSRNNTEECRHRSLQPDATSQRIEARWPEQGCSLCPCLSLFSRHEDFSRPGAQLLALLIE